MNIGYGVIALVMSCGLFLASASVNASVPKSTADVFASAEPVVIDRARQFIVKDGERHYQLMIRLPADYHRNNAHRYPVIYMTDSMYSLQVVSGATQFPMNSNIMKQAILVAIGYQKGSKGAASRVRDYTPSHDASWTLNTGEAKRHLRFIRHTVMPFVEQHFRVDTQQNTFVGNSLGGLFGAYVLLEQPTLFNLSSG